MDYELHVDPCVETEGDGTTRFPFTTIEAARHAIRVKKLSPEIERFEAIRVVLHKGIHILTETLTLTSEDGGSESQPIVYTSAPGERAIISGGEKITDWRRGDDGVWTAKIAGASRVRTLRFGDDDAILARYPSFVPEHPTTGGWLFADWWGKSWERGNFNTSLRGAKHKGDRISWQADTSDAGEYHVWIAYSRGPEYGSLDTDLKVRVECTQKGDAFSAAPFSLSHTAGGRGHRIERAGSFRLQPGSVEISLENVSGGDFGLHTVTLTDDSQWDPNEGIEILQFWGDFKISGLRDGAALFVLQAEAATEVRGEDILIPRSEPPGKRDRLVVMGGAVPEWSRWDLVDLHIFPAWGWVNQIIGIAAVDEATSTLWVDSPHDIRPGNRFFLAGSPEALSAPSEFFHDPHEQLIGYIPKGNEIETATGIAARLRTLIKISTTHVQFENIDFCDADYNVPDGGYSPNEAAIVFSGSEHCTVENCRFSHLGGYAVRLEECSHHIKLITNSMKRLGGGAIVLTGDNETQPTDNEIIANVISECGRIFKHVSGVLISSGSRNHVAHNRISNMPRYAVSAKSHPGSSSRENIIEFNDIENTNLETNDTGAIETLGRDKEFSGNVIRYNRIRNVVGLKTTQRGEFMSPHYTWGIYLDDFSSGTTIVGNIVEGTVLGGVNLHGGRDNTIENNILLNGSERQISFSPIFSDPDDRSMQNNVALRNIIAGPPSEFFIFGRPGSWYRTAVSDCDYNCYHRYGGDLHAEGAGATPEGPYESWQAAGFDAHSVVEDPLIEHDERGFAFPGKDSPVWKLGFKRIPVEKIGPEGYAPGAHQG
jgi:parallel beta-helix repeat protein